jgi:HPt (histidine-containing phosphotransfer) domain-containing protein
LEALVSTTRLKSARAEAHSLKSTSATFGFDLLATFCRRLESDAEILDAAEYAALLADMRSAFSSGLGHVGALAEAA